MYEEYEEYEDGVTRVTVPLCPSPLPHLKTTPSPPITFPYRRFNQLGTCGNLALLFNLALSAPPDYRNTPPGIFCKH